MPGFWGVARAFSSASIGKAGAESSLCPGESSPFLLSIFFFPKTTPNAFVNAIFPAVSRAGNFTPQKLRAPHVTIKLLKATEDSEDSGFPRFQETGLFLHYLPPAGMSACRLLRCVGSPSVSHGLAWPRPAEPAVSLRSCRFLPAKCRLKPAVWALGGCSDSFVLDLLYVGFLSQTKDVFGNDAALLSPATL